MIIINCYRVIIILSAAIYFQLDFIWVLLNIKTFQIGRLRVNMANSGKCRNKNEMRQFNNKSNQKGMIWDFNQLIRMKGFDPGKSPLKDKPIYLVLYQQPFSHSCPDYCRSLDLLIWQKQKILRWKMDPWAQLGSNKVPGSILIWECCFNLS